jgi:Carboxypeptidase regulatory-like domain
VSKGFAFIKSASVALAMVGIVFPQTRILAEQKLSPAPAVKIVPENSVLDVSLGKSNAFNGRTVDHTGAPVKGAKVVLKQGKTEVGQSVTDSEGRFAVENLKSGVYQVSCGATEGTYRLWSQQSAPPAAKTQGLLVLGENGARGQYGCCCDDGSGMWLCAAGAILAGIAIAALVIAINANNKSDNDNPPRPVSP